MALRRLTTSDPITVGMRVAVRYFDPSGPHTVDNMTTEHGTIVEINGDPWSIDSEPRPIIVAHEQRRPFTTPEQGIYDVRNFDQFASSLWIDEPDAPSSDADDSELPAAYPDRDGFVAAFDPHPNTYQETHRDSATQTEADHQAEDDARDEYARTGIKPGPETLARGPLPFGHQLDVDHLAETAQAIAESRGYASTSDAARAITMDGLPPACRHCAGTHRDHAATSPNARPCGLCREAHAEDWDAGYFDARDDNDAAHSYSHPSPPNPDLWTAYVSGWIVGGGQPEDVSADENDHQPAPAPYRCGHCGGHPRCPTCGEGATTAAAPATPQEPAETPYAARYASAFHNGFDAGYAKGQEAIDAARRDVRDYTAVNEYLRAELAEALAALERVTADRDAERAATAYGHAAHIARKHTAA